MRKMHRTAVWMAGLALAAGAALGGGMPAASAATAGPAAAAAPMGIPSYVFSEGFLVNANSGKCLVPSRSNPFGDGDLVVQLPCDGTTGQAWEFEPVGNQLFINQLWPIPNTVLPALHIVNAGTGLCLDDRDGAHSDGAAVQEWTCNSTNTSMMWAALQTPDGNNVLVNARATRARSNYMYVGMASGSTEDNVPAQLFSGDFTTSMEFTYNRIV